MGLQEITKSTTTTVTQKQTQATEPPQPTNMGLLAIQPVMGMELQRNTPATWMTPLGVTLMVALSMRAGEGRV